MITTAMEGECLVHLMMAEKSSAPCSALLTTGGCPEPPQSAPWAALQTQATAVQRAQLAHRKQVVMRLVRELHVPRPQDSHGVGQIPLTFRVACAHWAVCRGHG